jgi:hypothetical protein
MKQKISFIEFNEDAKYCQSPVPSNTTLPEWFVKMNLLISGEKRGFLDNQPVPNTTVKSCSPFLDALTTGYIFTAQSDIEIRLVDNKVDFCWRPEINLITDHSKNQHPTLPPAFNGYDFVMKWTNNFVIKTPPGYSTFFTHPLNRNELPFRTFSGVVDTDTYCLPVVFPFQLMKMEKFPIIIEKNTPLCQFFPFKRENWKSERVLLNNFISKKNSFEYFSKVQKAYKSRHWKKKEYK